MPETILQWLQRSDEPDLGAALVRLARLAEAAHRFEHAAVDNAADDETDTVNGRPVVPAVNLAGLETTGSDHEATTARR